MTSLLRSVLPARRDERSTTSVDDYIDAVSSWGFSMGGLQTTMSGLTGTYGTQTAENVSNDLTGYATAAYQANGVVFACMLARLAVFSTIRFQWQQLRDGTPSRMFGTPALQPLERPWVGGTTQDLLVRMIQDADLAGNSYWAAMDGELVRLRPDWVQIVMEPRLHGREQVGWRRLGYAYWEGGIGNAKPAVFLADEVAHYAPTPDPLASFRGMSWLTPVLREITNDKAMLRHKSKFLENAATPNLSVSLDKDVRREAFAAFKATMEANHRGVDNAYKTLYLGGGADVKVIGADFRQMDFKAVQGHGETRIAAAAGVPPIIVGLSEGLASATYSNYGQARRRFADGTMHPLWQNAAGSLAPLIASPGRDVRLWYDARDVPFLREDRKDAAEIQQAEALTIRTLVDAGYHPDAVIAAVTAEDFGLLQGNHSGLFSVMLQPPGTPGTTASGTSPDSTTTPTEASDA